MWNGQHETEHHDALYDAEVLAKMLIRYSVGHRPKWDDVQVNLLNKGRG